MTTTLVPGITECIRNISVRGNDDGGAVGEEPSRGCENLVLSLTPRGAFSFTEYQMSPIADCPTTLVQHCRESILHCRVPNVTHYY